MKVFGFLSVLLTGFLLAVVVRDFPDWGDSNSSASLHVSPRYISETLKETAVPNMVTSVLADYRGFDTMFETTVIFTAGVAVFLILRQSRKPGEPEDPVGPPVPDLIVQKIVRMVIPFMQLYGLYVVAHGHSSPGGGFQGGVILGASFILYAATFDLKAGLGRFGETTGRILGAVGVFIYAGIGALCLALGGNFLDYAALDRILPDTGPIMARYHGMLGIEIGVAVAVMSIMVTIYLNVASMGRFERGL